MPKVTKGSGVGRVCTLPIGGSGKGAMPLANIFHILTLEMLRRGGADPNGQRKGGSFPGNRLGVRSELPKGGGAGAEPKTDFSDFHPHPSKYAPLNNYNKRHNKTLTTDRLVVTVDRVRIHVGGAMTLCHILRSLLLKSLEKKQLLKLS